MVEISILYNEIFKGMEFSSTQEMLDKNDFDVNSIKKDERVVLVISPVCNMGYRNCYAKQE